MLSSAQLKAVGDFDEDTINALNRSLGGTETISAAGALSLLTYESMLAVSGTMALTLAAPTVAGQRKRIVCVSAASIPAATLTITSPDTTTGFALSSTFFFDTAGQGIELVATSGLLWRATRVIRAGTTIPVLGTTVLTGKNLYLNYSCSVTGTAASSSTEGLPNGQVAGERCYVGCSTAASIPVGSITFTGISLADAALTDLQAIGATTDSASLEWTGTAWLVTQNNGLTLA